MPCFFFTACYSGSKLRIINTGMAMGFRTMSSRTEASSTPRASDLSIHFVSAFQIWDDTNKRLCVTAINVRLQPSPAKRKAKL